MHFEYDDRPGHDQRTYRLSELPDGLTIDDSLAQRLNISAARLRGCEFQVVCIGENQLCLRTDRFLDELDIVPLRRWLVLALSLQSMGVAVEMYDGMIFIYEGSGTPQLVFDPVSNMGFDASDAAA